MNVLNTDKEPVLAYGGLTLVSITALAVAFIGLARAFGFWDISAEQEGEILKFIAAMWAVGIPLGTMIRGKVYSPNTVENIKETLVNEDPATPLSKEGAAAMAK